MAEGMDQISKPFLVALIAVVGFAGAWMTVLRPKPGSDGGGTSAPPVAAAPGTKGLGRAVDRAHGAVAASERAAKAAERAAGEKAPAAPAAPVATPAETAPPAPKPAAPADVTTVLLFAADGPDDAAARSVVRSIHGPHLKVVVAGLDKVASYSDLLGSTEVDTAPTIFVIGPDHRATRIVGLPDREQVLQAVSVRS
jgi:hypothetical protein